MWTPRYFVRLVDLPEKVRGVTVPNDDGTFDIYLSLRLSPERRRACLEHELRHIRRDHFYSSLPVEDLEREAHGLPAPKLVNVFDLPDPALIPHFPSLDAFLIYVRKLTEQIT